jgi:TolB protein
LGNDPGGAGVALLLIELGADDARIVEVGQPYYLDWHPRDPTLVVHVGPGDLALLDAGGERDRVAVELGDFQAPAWTGEGGVLAPVSSEGATASLGPEIQATIEELAVIDATDGSYRPVAVVDEMVMFEASGERLAYVEGDAGLGPLTVVGLDGKGRVEVADDDVVAFEWSPGGDLLLYLVLDAGAGLVPHIWDGEEVDRFAPFEPTDVFVSQYLPFWSQYVRTITQWAPDGGAFAYADGSDQPTVWIQPREGERRAMGPGAMVSWSP